MTEISELERRMTAALDRIGSAAGRMDGGNAAELAAALEAERIANAQLEARVQASKEKQETRVAALEEEVRELSDALARRDTDLGRMAEVNAALRASNIALREANAAGLPDAELVNAALAAEVEALKASAEVQRAEMAEVADLLEPFLKEA